MRARGADLATLWEGVCYRFERLGQRVPPWRWRLVHTVVHWILLQGVVVMAQKVNPTRLTGGVKSSPTTPGKKVT